MQGQSLFILWVAPGPLARIVATLNCEIIYCFEEQNYSGTCTRNVMMWNTCTMQLTPVSRKKYTSCKLGRKLNLQSFGSTHIHKHRHGDNLPQLLMLPEIWIGKVQAKTTKFAWNFDRKVLNYCSRKL